jgi:hypothetical protein
MTRIIFHSVCKAWYAAARELVRYVLDVVGVDEVRWDKGGTVRAEDYDFFLRERKLKSSIANRFILYTVE